MIEHKKVVYTKNLIRTSISNDSFLKNILKLESSMISTGAILHHCIKNILKLESSMISTGAILHHCINELLNSTANYDS